MIEASAWLELIGKAICYGWGVVLLAIAPVTLAGLLCHAAKPGIARKIDALALGMAVGCLVFPASMVACAVVFEWLHVFDDPVDLRGCLTAMIGALSVALPCGAVSWFARAVSRQRLARSAPPSDPAIEADPWRLAESGPPRRDALGGFVCFTCGSGIHFGVSHCRTCEQPFCYRQG